MHSSKSILIFTRHSESNSVRVYWSTHGDMHFFNLFESNDDGLTYTYIGVQCVIDQCLDRPSPLVDYVKFADNHLVSNGDVFA